MNTDGFKRVPRGIAADFADVLARLGNPEDLTAELRVRLRSGVAWLWVHQESKSHESFILSRAVPGFDIDDLDIDFGVLATAAAGPLIAFDHDFRPKIIIIRTLH